MAGANVDTVKRILVLGPTGTIGQAVVRALLAAGHDVACVVRPNRTEIPDALVGAAVRYADVSDPEALRREGFGEASFDAVVCCLASRTGHPADAWAIDHAATVNAIDAAVATGVRQFVLLSAICVQKPLLEFQRAKLAAESALKHSGLVYSIVRPTAFFKSLSGQIDRVRRGKPYLMFGDGQATACKPISDGDLADFIVGCLDDPARQNAILPIGGPGPAVTPQQQGAWLFELLGTPSKVRRVPFWFMDGLVAVLSLLGRFSHRVADKAEFARIGRYYATQSMLVWDDAAGAYDADATPSFGSDTLKDFYADVINKAETVDLGDHGIF